MLGTIEAAQGPRRQERATAGEAGKVPGDGFSSRACRNSVKPREGSWRLPGGKGDVETRGWKRLSSISTLSFLLALSGAHLEL